MEIKLISSIISLLHLACGFPVAGFASHYPVGQTYHYHYVTETLFNEPDKVGQSSPGKKDVGVKFTGIVELTPVWNNNQHMLVKLSVSDPHAYLESVSRKDVQQQLKTLPKLPIYFVWSEGQIGSVYQVDKDNDISVNLKKGVASLFQLANVDKERSELDTSGQCDVSYQVEGDVIKKSKKNCVANQAAITNNIHPLLQDTRKHSVDIKYMLKDNVIEKATAEERYQSTLNLHKKIGTSVVVKTEMKLKSKGRGKQYNADDVENAIKKISKGEGYQLRASNLATEFDQTCQNCSKFQEVVSRHASLLDPEQTGTIPQAYAFLDLVEVAKEATEKEIKAALQNNKNKNILATIIDAISAAQTSAGQKALMSLLNFQAEEEIDLQERYLLGAATSTYPHAEMVTDLLKLYKTKVPNSKLQESIGEALGTVVRTFSQRPGNQSSMLRTIQQALVDELQACPDETCRSMQLRAIGNTGITEAIPVLLNYAESQTTQVAETAMKALRHYTPKDLARPEVQTVVKRVFFQTKQGYDTAVRSQALSIILDTEPSSEDLLEILMASRDPWNTDYDKYIQARVFNAMNLDDKIRAAGEKALKSAEFQNWNFFAPKGKALAFTSWLAVHPQWSVPYFQYTENTRAGVLKRTGMEVKLTDEQSILPLYNFGLYAGGIESLLGEEVEDPDEVATAGLALELMGMSLRPITFFEGSGALLSAVWSAPTEPMSALQINTILQDFSQWLPLHNGFVVEVTARGALSLDLAGSLSVSLWNKNAQSFILNKGAVAIKGFTRLVTAGSSLRSGMSYTADGSTVITFQTDCNFYDGLQTCLQMYRPDFEYRHNVEKYESAFGLKRGFKSKVRRKSRSPGVCYLLPKPNDKDCRAMVTDS